MKTPIVIFHHVFSYGPWMQMVQEQLGRLKHSGLYDACDVMFVRFIGNDADLSQYREMIRPFKKIHLIGDHHNNDKEATTLKSVWLFAQEVMPFREKAGIDAHVLYFHTKGIYSGRHGGEVSIRMRDWRKFMEYFTIDQWRTCIEKLNNGNDICGVNWRVQDLFGMMAGHFSGNFWWAKLTYLYRLPEVKAQWDNAYYEFWIGQGQPTVHCMFESGIDHYAESFPPEKYTSRECIGD